MELLQGRIPKSVFARHYLKVEDVRELVKKLTAETEKLENTLSGSFISCLSNVSKAKKLVSSL